MTVMTPEIRAKISATLTGRPGRKHSEEARRKIGAGNRKPKPSVSAALKGHAVSEETRQRIRASKIGRPLPLGHPFTERGPRLERRGIPNFKMLGNVYGRLTKGHRVTEEQRQKMSIRQKGIPQPHHRGNTYGKALKGRPHSPEHCRKVAAAVKSPNKPERHLGQILNERWPSEWKFTGAGEFATPVGNKIPDFMHVAKPLIIEVYGRYWHNDEEVEPRIAHFAAFGYKAIVIWQDELKAPELVVKRISDLVALAHDGAGGLGVLRRRA